MTQSELHRTYSTVVLALGTMLALIFLVSFGVLGVGRYGIEQFADVKYWYISSRMWLGGMSPYDYDQFQAISLQSGIETIERFAYPPTSFALGALISPFPFPIARFAWLVLNLAALSSILVAMRSYLREIYADRWQSTDFDRTFAALLIVFVGNPFTAHVIWLGQVTFLITAALMWGWRFIYSNRPVVGGLLLAVSGAKPQLSALVALWLLLDRQFVALAVAAAVSLVFIVVPFSVSGFALIGEWLSSMQGYQSEATKAIALSHSTNLRSVLHAIALTPEHIKLRVDLPLAMLATLLLYLSRNKYFSDQMFFLGFLIGAGLLLIFGRDYDYAACAPLLIAAAVISKGQLPRQALLIALALILFIPHRLVMLLGDSKLVMWRPITFLVIVAALAYWHYSDTQSVRAAARSRLGANT